MRRVGQYHHAAAHDLRAQLPKVERVRKETGSVLFGATAQATDNQFSLLFDGDHSIEKLADALEALGELSETCATDIEHAKMWIVSTLALAARDIQLAWANAQFTGGWSLAAIPAIEAVTAGSIRTVARQVQVRVAASATSTLDRTMVKQLVAKGRQDMVRALGQDAGIQAYQLAAGHRDALDAAMLQQTAILYGVGGAVQKPMATMASGLLGPGGSVAAGAVKGALAEAVGSGAGRAAGILAVGGQPDAVAVLGAAAKSSIKGGIQGASSRPEAASAQ